MKKLFVLLGAATLLSGAASAQVNKCSTDDYRRQQIKLHPEILQVEAQLEKQIHDQLSGINRVKTAFAKGADFTEDTTRMDVTLVFHVVHDYGEEDVTDSQIFAVVDDMNQMYNRQNPDSVGIIPPYNGLIRGTHTKYRGKANIHFHLATKDPFGNPTHGITRTHSYFANNAGDQSKLEQWAPDSYVNIWLIHNMSGIHASAAAYATTPGLAVSEFYGDGVISIVQPGTGNDLNTDHTISHEVGHIFNLQHPFGQTNTDFGVNGSCNGDDFVDDTPPTKGHQPSSCSNLAAINDTACATGYMKTYSKNQYLALYGDTSYLAPGGSVIVDYPDTVNSQNVMDYTYCSKMFTHGQIMRMRAALNSDVANRDSLISPLILARTGAFAPFPDLPPVADFSTPITQTYHYVNPNVGNSYYTYNRSSFICADGTTTTSLKNFSYQDTISSYAWTLDHGASIPTSSDKDVNFVSFTDTGWVKVSLTVTSNAGSNTLTRTDAIYAADPTSITNPAYTMGFNANDPEVAKWPIFNYYGGAYKWEVINTAGYQDNSSIRFTNYDPRPYYLPTTQTLTPDGTYSEFISRAFDLTNSTADTKLSFAYAGAARTNDQTKMNDKLEIFYSTDCGAHFSASPMATLQKGQMANNGLVTSQFAPTYSGQWKWFGTDMPPAVAGADKVFFKFRYTVGSGDPYQQLGTGNNFYMDNISVNDYALGVIPTQLEAQGIVLSPNPTSGAATVTIRGGDNSTALVHVTDITGKVIYSTQVSLNATATKVQIPAERIAVKGLYMVEVITNGKTMTQKLSVY